MKLNGIINYLYEVGLLKHQKRTGWWRMMVKDPESVAEHSHRAAVIGYILASLEEGVNAERVAVLCLFHDTSETRTGDLSWLNQRYIAGAKEGERKAILEQTAQLPQVIAQKVVALSEEFNSRVSREAQLAKDADLLECLLQCREYAMQGYVKAQSWADMCYAGLRTETAQNLARECLIADPGQWFETLQENPSSGSTDATN
ncbi:HD domain-containing protein [Ktedonobacter robiniae]|uniref:5'-deoxynucleotidase n=1 Tax=Ktedonobacter robiniae TaxID=2778365 RepID=A0ABQ3V2S5_9CHLR|nr:HD domain-containing protein [Ktedonobacter robiniae]GHO59288.1 haloacid dehalogenase [Ktedonobacter robiniae]